MNSPKLKSRAVSLTRLNPYFNKVGYHLPYKYADPTFRKDCQGLFLKKDVELQKLIHKNFGHFPNIKIKKIKKHYFIDSNNSAYPKEIILNTVFPIYRTKGNLVNKFMEMQEKNLFNFNPYITKYGSFSFGKNKKKKKIILPTDLKKNDGIKKIQIDKNIINNFTIDKSYSERLKKKARKKIIQTKHNPIIDDHNFIGSFLSKGSMTDKRTNKY